MLAPNLLKHWGYRPWRAFHRGRTGSGEKGALEAGCISAQCLFNLSFLSFFTFLSFDFVDLCSFCSSWLRPFPFHIVSHARRRLTAMSGMETENTGKEARRIRRILMQLLHRREGPGERCDSVQMCLNHFKPRNQMSRVQNSRQLILVFGGIYSSKTWMASRAQAFHKLRASSCTRKLRASPKSRKPRIWEAKKTKSENSFAPTSRKQKCTETQDFIFAQGRASSV